MVQALRSAQIQLDVAFENSPIGKAIISPEGNILRVNRAFVGLFDYEKNALLSMTLDGLTHPDDWQNAFDLNQRVLVGDIPGFQMEIRYIHAEGHTIWAQLNSTLVRDPDGLTIELNFNNLPKMPEWGEDYSQMPAVEGAKDKAGTMTGRA